MALTMELNRAGFWILAETGNSKERMHPLGNPLSEGTELYVRPCRIDERLEREETAALVVWDVGLGMGANALACIAEWRRKTQGGQCTRPLQIFSFENQFEGFRSVVDNRERFPHAADEVAMEFARQGSYEEEGLQWHLLEGDFFATYPQAAAPEVIFFDPFSRNTNPAFWESSAFTAIFETCRNTRTVLATYANARAVREAMQSAGWRVAVGPGFGNREQTTLAVTPLEAELASYTWWKGRKSGDVLL